jgi:hypothetical protein
VTAMHMDVRISSTNQDSRSLQRRVIVAWQTRDLFAVCSARFCASPPEARLQRIWKPR